MLIQVFQTGDETENNVKTFNTEFMPVDKPVNLMGYVKPQFPIINPLKSFGNSLSNDIKRRKKETGIIDTEVKTHTNYNDFLTEGDRINFRKKYRFSTIGQYSKKPIEGITDIMVKPNQTKYIPNKGVVKFATYYVPKDIPEEDKRMIYNSIVGPKKFNTKYDQIVGISADWIKKNQL